MTVDRPQKSRRGLLLKLAVLALVALGAGVLVLRGVDLRHWLDVVLAWIRSVGPVAFFVGMAVMPAFGFPLLAFTLSAGPVFSPQLGLPLVCVLTTLSILANLALTYWLARYAFRPLLEGIIRRMGYQLPQVAAEDHLSLTVLLRVTPGPPFFVQGYLLGLSGVRFRIYMLVSSIIAVAYALALIVFGDAVVKGKGQGALIAFSLIIALSVIVQWVRRKYSRRKAAQT